MEITVNTTNTENGCINVDERVLANIVKDLVESAASSDFGRALSAVKNIATVPTTQPIAEADVPKEIIAKAEENKGTDPEAVKEYATTEAKADADVKQELTGYMILLELSKFGDNTASEIAQKWMGGKADTIATAIKLTKLYCKNKPVFESLEKEMNRMSFMGNEKLAQFLGLMHDVCWNC